MSEAQRAIRRKALDLLARREHSRAELERKLGGRGFDANAVGPVLDALVREHLLSDERFAEAFARQRVESGYGPLRIRSELRQRGVTETGIASALSAFDARWAACAQAAHRKRFGETPPSTQRERARRFRYLEYRGFTHEQIRATLPD